MRSAHVHVLHGELRGTARVVPATGLVLGRQESASGAQPLLALPDAKISRRHAELRWDETGWQLHDLGSRNGGFVDGKVFHPGERIPLHDSALLRIGDSLLIFRSAAASAESGSESDSLDPGAFPGCSPGALAVRGRLAELRRSSGPVLILGETGTGKERVARALGAPSGSFVPQNCAELSRELARSDLFGHLRGSFSGAHPKPGLVEHAHGGVLFLDEIGELDLEVQAELLRFIEDGQFRPVGGTTLQHSSARIVAATNVDLDQAVQHQRFRRDLLARLRAANHPLELPPLRTRTEDLLQWAERFTAEFAGTGPSTALHWSVGALECLALYPWPDNLRELRGVIRALLTAGLARTIVPDDLPAPIRMHRRALRACRAVAPALQPLPAAAESPGPLAEAPQPARRVDEPTREEIEAAMVTEGGRMRVVALRLGIDRRKLYRLCERHTIDLSKYRSPGDDA